MIGGAIVDELPALLNSFGISGTAEVHRFAVAGRMQKRTHSQATAEVVAAAKADKAETDRPFWDALFRQVAGQPPEVQADVVRQAKYHHTMAKVATSTRFPLRRRAQVAASLAAEVHSLSPGQILALSSRLISDGGDEWHIPMLDYRIPVSDENEALVVAHLGAMGEDGWLLRSGRSYHYIGLSLLAGPEGLMRFLGTALLFAPMVDGRWVAHQLIEGACSLRVSSGDARQPPPWIVCAVPRG
jgi:hypothetical protein